jgi:hypothetical protein
METPSAAIDKPKETASSHSKPGSSPTNPSNSSKKSSESAAKAPCEPSYSPGLSVLPQSMFTRLGKRLPVSKVAAERAEAVIRVIEATDRMTFDTRRRYLRHHPVCVQVSGYCQNWLIVMLCADGDVPILAGELAQSFK